MCVSICGHRNATHGSSAARLDTTQEERATRASADKVFRPLSLLFLCVTLLSLFRLDPHPTLFPSISLSARATQASSSAFSALPTNPALSSKGCAVAFRGARLANIPSSVCPMTLMSPQLFSSPSRRLLSQLPAPPYLTARRSYSPWARRGRQLLPSHPPSLPNLNKPKSPSTAPHPPTACA